MTYIVAVYKPQVRSGKPPQHFKVEDTCKYYRKLDVLLARHDRAEEALEREEQA